MQLNTFVTRNTTRIFFILASTLWHAASTALAQGVLVGNGGDSVIFSDGSVMAFDEVEYLEPFTPDTQGEAWTIIDKRLTAIQAKLPHTSNYLRRILVGGDTLWWFVNAKLREISDHGQSAVIVTTEMQQIAANSDGVIQIYKSLWDKMTPRSKASIMMHEAMWTAVGPQNVNSGSSVRFLAQLFLNPSIENMPGTQLVSFIKPRLSANSPLLQVIELDLQNGKTAFQVAEVVGDARRELVITTQISSQTANSKTTLQMTTFNPDTQNRFIFRSRGRPFGYIAESYNGTLHNNFRLGELCQGLTYAGKTDWRLPTRLEVNELFKTGLMSVQHVQSKYDFKITPASPVESVNSSRVYPVVVKPMLIATAEGRILDLANMAADVTGLVRFDYEPIHYICVQ